MPSDIRSFFGGGGQGTQKLPARKEEAPPTKKRGRPATRRVIHDDSEEDDAPTKPTPKKSAPKAKREPTPEGQATTTSDYFGSKKPKRSEPVKRKNATTEVTTPKASPKSSPAKSRTKPSPPATNGRTSTRAKKPMTYNEDEDNIDAYLNDDDDGADDIFAADFKNRRIDTDNYVESLDVTHVKLPHHQTPKRKGTKKAKDDHEENYEPDGHDINMKDTDADSDFTVSDDHKEAVKSKSKDGGKSTKTSSRKRKSVELSEEDEEAEPSKKTRKAAPAKKSPVKKKAKKEDVPENPKVQEIFDSIPTIRPPTPPPASGEAKKFNFRAQHANSGAPPSAGSADIPTGQPNCLAGLTFVFTGLLQTLQREEGQALVKRYGGKVTTAPSKKTSYVVLGSDAGPKKLQTIRTNGIKTIDEDGLFELIRRLPANGGDSKAAAAYEEKQKAEEEKIKKMAAEMEREERQEKQKAEEAKMNQLATRMQKGDQRKDGAGRAGGGKASSSGNLEKAVEARPDNRLWTVKYAPTQLSQICGNKTQVDKLQKWLKNFPRAVRTNFKLAGADGSGTYRAVIIHGPPGIGKTTAAHLVAKLEGYDIVESNASDTRSKKLVEEGLRGVLSTTSLLGYFSGDGKQVEASKKKMVLIMDEVDGMSAGDRGGVGALAAVCKKTQVPMILICNDRRLPKMKPFDHCTYDLPFRRPTVDHIRSRIMTIAFREGLKVPPNVINALIEGSNADIRQVVNMVSTAKLDQEAMDFDGGKSMSKAWEKHVILKPWDIVGKILGGGMFAASSKATLNEKIELYFNDHELSYLMLQENYLGTNPIVASTYTGKERNLKMLELVDNAASSISDGDLVDRMIHGSQQQWSLMPTHAAFSFVRPASFVSGSMAGYKTGFPSWLGKNSSAQKMQRMVKEIQGHMRLRSSADRHEIRQSYVPVLWSQMVKKLETDGKEAVPAVIDLMDSYFLTKDDFDAIQELGVGYMDQEKVNIESQAKATFTRLYNQQSHPLPFMKAGNVLQPKAKQKEQPDLEEAIEESDDDQVINEVKEEDEEEVDLSKDKYVKQPKKKKAAAKPKPAAKKRTKKDDSDEELSDEEEVKPKKGKAVARGNNSKGRGRGRK
ncbi:DNA replication factor C, large subunit [Pseudovirgaria hyperparasitica]|uniref:Replication factor C subunit 1 n=1 Tax=Pseudovirgaria hyperparasitica TaxID=470096 RepID=A0A6A6WCL4_9PEZI|nr:DNA replication factor C, large subunit [Pseudovirgaria hyperparasitica]KAF2760568.1 DNA replication factor C, large subunit [Pseudovirgaria hyperparasitica]